MKINKDLVDATMMLSFIILVLIGTSDFSNMLLKEITMGGLALLSVAMILIGRLQPTTWVPGKMVKTCWLWRFLLAAAPHTITRQTE